MGYQFVGSVDTSSIIVRIETKIKIKKQGLTTNHQIFKYPINADLQNMVSVVS
jgi:hypothetical protein